MDGPYYEVMVDAWGWGDPHQFVRGDVISEADAEGFDVPWALNMGSIRRMGIHEVRGLEAMEMDNGFNPAMNPVTGLYSTVRMFEEEAEARDSAGILTDEFKEGEPKAIPGGGGTSVDQVKLENQQAGLTGAAASESTSSGAAKAEPAGAKKDDK